MVVLSLFDGMACGRVALGRAGVNFDRYLAAEIDPHASAVAAKNYPDIIHLGDVTKWRQWDVDWHSVGLVMGGSPCQGFSAAGKGAAFNDPRSALFFTFVEILAHVRTHNSGAHFLLENVKMKKEYLDVISMCLGVSPVFINSELVSAQKRQRYYWASWPISQPVDKGLLFDDILEDGEATRQRNFSKRQRPIAWLSDTETRHLTPLECERLQTLPEGYTEGVPKSERYKMIGNGWTVDVIAHLFSTFPTTNRVND